MVKQDVVERACAVWELGTEPWGGAKVVCRSAVLPNSEVQSPRTAYLSVGSPIERVLGGGSQVLNRGGGQVAVEDLARRLVNGEVAALLADSGGGSAANSVLPAEFRRRRQEVRNLNVRARFLLRQIGLEEVANHRGAASTLYDAVAAIWSIDLALCTDPAMMLSLGADRQRYVDTHYVERSEDRLPRALARLSGLGVRSYPRLVIV